MNTHDPTRREWLKASYTAGAAALLSRVLPASILATSSATARPAAAFDGSAGCSAWMDVDYRALVSRSDLIYRSPVAQPIEGQPIGNGVMGTLVWTSPTAVHLQINRCDVFAVNKYHRAGAQFGPTDYCGACAQVTIDVGGDVFAPRQDFMQRLSVYDAGVTITSAGLQVRCFVSAEQDLLVVEVDDQRSEPAPLQLTLSHWRPGTVTTGEHTASWEIVDVAPHMVLTQRFREGDYHCDSAVAVAIAGHDPPAVQHGEGARVLRVPARTGTTRILISSAASQVAPADVTRRAVEVLTGAATLSADTLLNGHRTWWHEFWSRSFVHVTSADGMADFMERVRTLYLYLMASTSRGALPPKWNGSLFSTDGDARTWGSQFWIWTTEIAYWPLYAANATTLTDPFFEMYLRQLPDCQHAAQQRWGVGGAFYPETNPFDGPVVLPEEIAREYQDVYRGRKRNTELSSAARRLGQFDGGLNVIDNQTDMAAGRYSYISHVCSSGAELAVHAWWRFRHTGDMAWLRSHAYPLLRENAEFYRQLVQRGEDGRYHLRDTNVHEDFWGVDDSIMDLAAIRGTVPLALRAAEMLGVDEALRPGWQELLQNLTPYPLGSNPQAQALTGACLADDVWAAGLRGEVDGQHNPEDVWLNPVFPFEDWTLATQQPDTDRIVQKVLDLAARQTLVLGGAGLNTAIRTPIATVRAGRGTDLPRLLASYYAAFAPLCNGLSMFEGPKNAQSLEHLALLSMTLQEALLQSVSPRPGEPETIYVFPAWPREWNATVRLAARGGFLVTAAIAEGDIVGVELVSSRGESCRLQNPWTTTAQIVEFSDTGQQLSAQNLAGTVLELATKAGHTYRITAVGANPLIQHSVSPPQVDNPTTFRMRLANEVLVQGTLGRL